MKMNSKRWLLLLATGAVAVISAGCAPDVAEETPITLPPPPSSFSYQPSAEAGVRVDPQDGAMLVAANFPSRANPFALLPEEQAYERDQRAANILQRLGGWSFYYQEEPPVIPPIEYEEQPYRRLAGIIIGDSVSALIDMGDGRLRRIRPGMTIEGTEWQVVSIDEEKAVLRRVGPRRNVRPTHVVVRLEANPRGGSGGGGRTSGGGGGGGSTSPGPAGGASAQPSGGPAGGPGGAAGAAGGTIDR